MEYFFCRGSAAGPREEGLRQRLTGVFSGRMPGYTARPGRARETRGERETVGPGRPTPLPTDRSPPRQNPPAPSSDPRWSVPAERLAHA